MSSLSSLIGDIKSFVRRVLFMLINGFLSYEMIVLLTGNNQLGEIVGGFILAISFLVGEILAPIIVIADIGVNYKNLILNLATNFSSVSISSIESLVITIVFEFIIPLITVILFRNSNAFLSAGSLLLIKYNPLYSILLFSGVSIPEQNYVIPILASLPLFALYPSVPLEYVIIIVLFTLIGAIIYNLNMNIKYVNLFGFLPLVISNYLLVKNYNLIVPYPFLPSIISLVIFTIIFSQNIYSQIVENKKEFESLKSALSEEINNIINTLYYLRNNIKKGGSDNKNDVIEVTNKYVNAFTTLQQKIGSCKNVACLNEVKEEITNNRRVITIELNNLIFDEIRDYNEFIDSVKFLGINADSIQFPKDEVKIEDFVDFYNNLKSIIDKNTFTIANILNKFIDNIRVILGSNLSKLNIINRDNILDLIKSINANELNTNINLCLSRASEIAQVLLVSNEYSEIKKDLATLPLQQFTINKVTNAQKILEKFINHLLTELSVLSSSISDITKRFDIDEIVGLNSILSTLISIVSSNEVPYCERISRVYMSLANISTALEYAKEKDVLLKLDELVSLLMQEIITNGYIDLNDFGINSKYSDFIVRLLNKKGIMSKAEGTRIVVIKSRASSF
ncbi:MAG: hypothetical protein RXR59_02730 [Sulfolobus sp.]